MQLRKQLLDISKEREILAGKVNDLEQCNLEAISNLRRLVHAGIQRHHNRSRSRSRDRYTFASSNARGSGGSGGSPSRMMQPQPKSHEEAQQSRLSHNRGVQPHGTPQLQPAN